jgi:hypothetical protein
MLAPLHVVLAMPEGLTTSRLLALFEGHGRVTRVTSRIALRRVLVAHPEVDAVFTNYGLADGCSLRVIARFARARRQGWAYAVLPKTVHRIVISQVAAAGAILMITEFIDDKLLRTLLNNILRHHFEQLLDGSVPEECNRLTEAIERWRRRFDLSDLDLVLLKIRSRGYSPHELLQWKLADEVEAALLARVDAESPSAMIDRLFREAFGDTAKRFALDTSGTRRGLDS